jgi:hypothetical protein
VKESFWGVFVIILGITTIIIINLFQTITNVDEHNYTLLKETTEAAMIDAFDVGTFTATGNIRIDREKFVENFARRFSEDARLGTEYTIKIYDVHEYPPKVSLKVESNSSARMLNNDVMDFTIGNKLDAVLEVPY